MVDINLKSRRVALDLLRRLDETDNTTLFLFDLLMKRTDLSDLDKMFVRAMVLPCLRHFGQIDFILTQLLDKTLATKLEDIQWILRLGVCQIVYLNVPVHAAVDTAVELSKQIRKGAFSKLVNAVLRSCVRRVAEFQSVSPVYNLPRWLKKEFEQVYGTDLTQRFTETFVLEQPVDLTVKQNPTDWAEKLSGRVLSTGSVRLNDVHQMTELDGFKTGDWWVQNAAASVPAQLFNNLSEKRVADLCAAPGGKTAQLAQMGAIVDAFDISEFRLNRLQENMKRLGFHVQTRAIDVLQLTDKEIYDAVLLDAPCSATGTIGRHPEILRRLKKDDVKRLASLQKQLLNQAILMTKSGGQIVFSTCSLLPEEGEKIMQWALKKYPFLKRGKIPARLNDFANEQGDIRITPVDEMDGFFAGILIKTI